MGFGIRSFRKVTESENLNIQTSFIKNVVIGNSISAINAFNQMVERGEDVVLISENEIKFEDLIKDMAIKVQQIRGVEQREQFLSMSPSQVPAQMSESPVFYKDGEFRAFTSKIKLPMPLSKGEQHFTKPYYPVDLNQFVPCTSEFKEALKLKQKVLNIVEINSQTPSDLVNINNWKIELSDYSIIECENVFWANTLKDFLKITKNSDDLPDDLHQLSSNIKDFCGFEVSFELNQEIFDKNSTFFLPQSLTHEWGYFICEQTSIENKITLNVFCYVDIIHSSETDLGRKLKLMKRVLSRVFDDFNDKVVDEHIKFSRNIFSLITESDSFAEIENIKGLKVIGTDYNDVSKEVGFGLIRELSSFM